ncbi:acyl-CoA-binding domain-containing protein 5-like [Centruroides vittatus]|uniref:acyl-CoA-binding domain-containing protein 5-like n=1 Tax=Centruroides vittatus TaxID=120091 RepID=UPI0035104BB3
MTTEEKFQAAVNVIRNLPKDGSFQPTRAIQLKFYSYYKQATEGPCTLPKPNFWDLIARAKWDAWMKLGSISKEEAMECYVREMIKIVEDMAYSESVLKFMNILGLGGMISVDDIRKAVGATKKLDYDENKDSNTETSSDQESNEFYEPVESEYIPDYSDTRITELYSLQKFPESKERKYNASKYQSRIAFLENVEVNEQLSLALKKLQNTVDDVKKRLNSLELQVNKIPHSKEMQTTKFAMISFNSFSPMAKILIILWPFIVHWSMNTVHKRRRFIITNLLILFQYFFGLM